MFVKFFRNKEGRMPVEAFTALCVANEFKPPYVLQDAEENGYSFDKSFYCSLDLMVEMEAAKHYNQVN